MFFQAGLCRLGAACGCGAIPAEAWVAKAHTFAPAEPEW